MKPFIAISFVISVFGLLNCAIADRGIGFYSPFDPAKARHGSVQNERIGGTCSEFLSLNNMNSCCANREDECYMIHYDTRCYCDNFCDRPHTDCCPDAIDVCKGSETPAPTTTLPPTTVPPTTEPLPRELDGKCEKDGQYYNDFEKVRDNCNECTCYGGQWECTNQKCLVDVRLLSDINRSGGNWQAANYSKFWGQSLKFGYDRKLGTRLPIQKQRPFDPFLTYNPELLSNPVPQSYDFREDPEVKEYLRKNPIRDQGNCAASWAFSTVDVATDRLVKVSKGKHGNATAYSVQMLISCAILRDNQDGCSPSTTDIAWNFLNHLTPDAGIVEERCQPYINGDKENAEKCAIPVNSITQKRITCPAEAGSKRPYDGSLLLASPVYPLKVTSDEDIMREILIQGPVQAIFRVYSDFFMYKSGVYKWSRLAPEHDHREPYHSVKILGWGTENGEDYWLCANSWGEDWGENGYFKIKRGECEIGQHIFAAWGNGKVNGKLVVNNRFLLNKLLQSRS